MWLFGVLLLLLLANVFGVVLTEVRVVGVSVGGGWRLVMRQPLVGQL